MTRLAILALLQDPAPAVVPADTAWMLVSTALVLLMTPALAFFYGGLVRSKNSLNTMMMSFVALGVVGIVWALLGYSLAFGEGNAGSAAPPMRCWLAWALRPREPFPHVLFIAYQGTFAIITAALISGAVVERMRFGPYLAFIALWTVCRLRARRALGLGRRLAHEPWRRSTSPAAPSCTSTPASRRSSLRIVLGPRKDYARQAMLPHNVPFVLLGAGLLWFGWFGFNGGSALAANELAALAFTNTLLAPMATLVVWVLLDYFRTGHATAVGGATGIVVGLVAITPAAGFVSPASALLLGAHRGVAELLRHRAIARARGSTTRSMCLPATASAA